MTARPGTKIAASFPCHCRGGRCGRSGKRRTDLLCKGSHAARDDWIAARLATVFRASLATFTWEESAAPRHGGYIRIRHTALYHAVLAHLRRTAHAVGGAQIPAPAGFAADPFEELSRRDRAASGSCPRRNQQRQRPVADRSKGRKGSVPQRTGDSALLPPRQPQSL